ncbi:hypothetical protein C2845_PM13G24750 [Panicum miliaceum]|uniref:Polygalacturonase n=1 Tax=Panicum miliaceum TaxID=4540 RepID=A0A3L6RI15_PANMI|nr:hypothetical protein C2845_PM13G24750 [Panicum miliaceum]
MAWLQFFHHLRHDDGHIRREEPSFSPFSDLINFCLDAMASVPKALVVFFAVAVLLRGGHAHGKDDHAVSVHDVTEYGATPRPSNRDNRDAFLAAWRAACGSTAGNSTLVFPKGTFAVGAVRFEGPCASGDAPAVVIHGVLQPCAGGGGGCHISDDAWITFSGLNHLLVTEHLGAIRRGGGGGGGRNPSRLVEDTTEQSGGAAEHLCLFLYVGVSIERHLEREHRAGAAVAIFPHSIDDGGNRVRLMIQHNWLC